MPIIVQSPMAAAANTAASFLQGQTEASMRNRAAALAQQKQNSEDALQAAQAQMYMQHGGEFAAQGDQRTALTPALVGRMEAQGFKLRADGNFENAKGSILLPAQAAQLYSQADVNEARVPLLGAQTNLANANVGLTNAKTRVQLEGELPFLKAKTTYTNSLPAYDNAKINAMMAATNERGFAAAQSTAARINVAGLGETGRLVLGQMVNDRLAQGQSDKEAMDGALAQYRVESQAYTQQMGANNKATAAGQQVPYPNAKQPQFQQPNVSQGGVTLNVSLPSQGITQGPNGQPVYTRQPAHTINVQGEVNTLRGHLQDPSNQTPAVKNAILSTFNQRSDLTPQQKALIWTSASTPTQPQGAPSGFSMPLSNPAANQSPFGIPPTPLNIFGH